MSESINDIIAQNMSMIGLGASHLWMDYGNKVAIQIFIAKSKPLQQNGQRKTSENASNPLLHTA